jgi:hypothetical protein
MADCGGGFQASVKTRGGRDGAMAEDTAHGLVTAGVFAKVELGRDVPEQMRVNPQPSVCEDALAQPLPQDLMKLLGDIDQAEEKKKK